MAGNRRGRLKEHFEGIHKNFDWVIYHVNAALELIGDDNPKLCNGIKNLGTLTQTLDELAQETYHKL